MTFVELTSPMNHPVWVNLDLVVAITVNLAGGGSRLQLNHTGADGKKVEIVVKELPEVVMRKGA